MSERTKLPWMKFYPNDWRGDPGLRVCSLAARGLWMEMLTVMHAAEPIGSLVMNGRRMPIRHLAALVGASIPEVEELLRELADVGVFSTDDDGTIYSRRMRRDAAQAEADKANGKRGGNPDLKGGVNPPNKPPDKAQRPEARDQKPEDLGEAKASLVDASADAPLGEAKVVSLARKPGKAGKPEALLAVGSWWNEIAAGFGFPQIEAIKPGSTREIHTWTRARELAADFGSLSVGLAALGSHIRGSPFLQGQTDRPMRLTFDWVMTAGNFQKIMEGNYEDTDQRRSVERKR